MLVHHIFSIFEAVSIAAVLTFVFLHLLMTLYRALFPLKPPTDKLCR